MPIGDLLDLIICTECKTRVEYHDGPDGYMSCECWVRTTADESMPTKWVEIEDMKANSCGICGQDINERLVFRCADCGKPFHQVCLDQHCKHGTQKQELRSENLFLKQQVKNLEEYMLKGVAFRDELHAAKSDLEARLEKSEVRIGELECQKNALQQVNAELESKLTHAEADADQAIHYTTERAEKVEGILCSVGSAARDFHAAWLSRNSKITDHDWRLLMYEKEDVLTDALGLTTTVISPCRHATLLSRAIPAIEGFRDTDRPLVENIVEAVKKIIEEG